MCECAVFVPSKKSNEVENENLCRQPSTYALWRIIFIWNPCMKFVLSFTSILFAESILFFLVHSCITFAVCWVRRLCMFDVHFVSALPLLSACIISSHFSKVFFVSHYRLALAFSSQFQMKRRSLSFHEISCVTQVEVFNFGYLTRFFRFCLSTALAVFNLSDKINNIYSFNQSGLVTLSKYHNFIVHSISFG